MTAPTYGFWDYVKAAFLRRARLPGLGHMPLNLTGHRPVSPCWACGTPGSGCSASRWRSPTSCSRRAAQRFQKLIQGEALLRQQKGGEVKVQQVAAGPQPRRPWSATAASLDQCRLILGLQGPVDPSGTLGDLRGGSLNQLLWLFLRLLSSRELMIGTLAQVNPANLEARCGEAQGTPGPGRAREPPGPLPQGDPGHPDQAPGEPRKAKSNLEVVESELDRIEQQVRLIREESAVSGGPEFISARLDQVSATLSETSQWMDQHAEFFSSLAVDEPLAAGLTAPAPPAATPTVQAPPPGPPSAPPPRKRQREGG